MKRKFIQSVILALIFNSLFLINNSFSQWVHMNGPHGGDVKCIFVSGTNIFAGATGNGYKDTTVPEIQVIMLIQ